MKRTLILVLIILLLTAYASVINADLAGSQLLSTPEPTPPTPGPTATVTSSVTDNVKDSAMAVLAGSPVLSISLANLDPNPAIAGDIVEVRIGIENIGGTTAKNIMMEIVPEYPFELVSGENAVKDVGIIKGYQTDSTANLKIIKYKLRINKDTSAGSYELKVKYYELGSSDKIMKSLYIDVKSRANVEVIHIDKTALIPGKQSSLKFTINNVGNAPLRDVTFNWENKDNIVLPVGSDNTRYIKYIEINEEFDLEYQVIADTNANPGLYKLNIYLIYTDSINGTTKQLSTIAGVYVGGETNFDIVFSESTNGETSFSVANIGSNPAYAVLVSIPEQRSWGVSGSNSVMIGNLNSGDYTVASFKLQSSANTITAQNTASQNRPQEAVTNIQEMSTTQRPGNSSSEIVQMQIAYTDTMGERKVIEIEVKLGLQNVAATDGEVRVGRQGDPIYIVIGIAVLFLAFVAYRKYRRQKLLDPDFKIMDWFRSKKK
jgi:hypothetical protein